MQSVRTAGPAVMSSLDDLLNYPLTPSELVLLNGEAFAPRAGLADRLPLLDSEAVVTATSLIRTIFALAFLVNEQTGALRLQAGRRRTPFGPSRQASLFVEPGAAPPA